MPALIPLLLGLAPTVADWIFGDKTGKAVGAVTGIAKEILGTDDPGAIERAIAADPNLALQFKMAVMQAAADAKRADLDAFKAQLADVQNARGQTIELAKANSAIAWGRPSSRQSCWRPLGWPCGPFSSKRCLRAPETSPTSCWARWEQWRRLWWAIGSVVRQGRS